MDGIDNILIEELNNLKSAIIKNHIAAGQKTSGKTEKSLRVSVSSGVGVLFGRQAFQTLEHGRKKGKVPYNFNEIIKQWIIDKGINVQPLYYKRKPSERWQPKYTPEERGLLSLSSAIANKIERDGTKLFRDGGRDDIYTNEINDALSTINNRVGEFITLEINKIK